MVRSLWLFGIRVSVHRSEATSRRTWQRLGYSWTQGHGESTYGFRSRAAAGLMADFNAPDVGIGMRESSARNAIVVPTSLSIPASAAIRTATLDQDRERLGWAGFVIRSFGYQRCTARTSGIPGFWSMTGARTTIWILAFFQLPGASLAAESKQAESAAHSAAASVPKP